MIQEEESVTGITAQEFAALDFSKITVLDLREPDEVLVHPIEGALNMPFSRYATELASVPRDKPVYAICRTGDWSEQVAEILADRGYTVYNVLGGYKAYAEALGGTSVPSAEKIATATQSNGDIYIDAKALRCPGPIVKVADTLRPLGEGATVTVEATEDAFYSDIQVWVSRTGNELLSITPKNPETGTITARIRKTSAQKNSSPASSSQSAGNDKTFVVFSGDLDKTIAAFIIANGGASLGRKVTMFFTFWGLNILRKPKKVRVKKTFIEKMFGAMMPRGTKKLGLSRMNMGGMGAKMIRGIMKQKGVESLEELIQDAINHGVRIVACQMSMDIMGIKKEELIDGVELGGVATFIGSGETSDMSLFI